MPESPQEVFAPRIMDLRLLKFSVAVICAAAVCLLIAILHYPRWHPQLARLMDRAWSIFLAEDVGSTGRGFFNGFLGTVLSIIAVAVMTGYLHGWKEFRKHLRETAIITLWAVPTVAFVVYGTQFAWEVVETTYDNHEALRLENNRLNGKGLANPYRIKENLFYSSMINTFNAFEGLRGDAGLQKDRCDVIVTAPKENAEVLLIMSTVARSAHCLVEQPNPLTPDPTEKYAPTSGKVTVHAEEGRGESFAVMLSNAFQVNLSHVLPAGSPPGLVWIQIGDGDVWRAAP